MKNENRQPGCSLMPIELSAVANATYDVIKEMIRTLEMPFVTEQSPKSVVSEHAHTSRPVSEFACSRRQRTWQNAVGQVSQPTVSAKTLVIPRAVCSSTCHAELVPHACRRSMVGSDGKHAHTVYPYGRETLTAMV